VDLQRLQQQIRFIVEIDQLKAVLRRSYVISSRRKENSAEHSWHLAIMAVLLAEHANEAVDLLRVVKMLLIHDIVEIDAGDTYAYDGAGALHRVERERRAADRLFGLLPQDQASELHGLWEEFEARATPESRFAKALDHLMPLLHNYHTQGLSWQEHGITDDLVLAYNSHIRDGSEALWQVACSVIEESVAKGFLSSG